MKTGVILLALVCAAHVARAECPAIGGSDAAALTANGEDARLAWIQARLARTSHRVQVWRYAWGAGIIGATAVDLAMLPILGDTRSNRIDFGLGAATTLPGIVPLVFWTPRVLDDHPTLDAHVAAGGDRCAVLAEAENDLVAEAAIEAKQRAWYVHAGNVALNTGVVLLFGAFHHWTSGLLNGAGGALVGELIIFTQPIDQVDDLAHYRRGELGAPPVQHAWTVAPLGRGLTVSVTF